MKYKGLPLLLQIKFDIVFVTGAHELKSEQKFSYLDRICLKF